ncbi:MAG: DUF4080 domain-containing protein [Sulfurovaceae bacterium]|nr:DUF4080 domain-containing protein [Sulfurovaceae bacterium]
MSRIVLTTLNARYSHTSIALRYLYANLHEIKLHAKIVDFTIKEDLNTISEKLLENNPEIIGIGVYIWNASKIEQLLRILKEKAPEVIIVLGGPEVSYTPFRINIDSADYIVQGEGEATFYNLCKHLLNKELPKERIYKPMLLDAKNILLPYDYYSDEDIAKRRIYVEASRGCPFRCEFCLSSIDKSVRYFDEDKFLEAIEQLWSRGARDFRFIDRTFNLNISYANKLLDFFLAKTPPYFVHFEVIPEAFPDSIRERLMKFPPASLQLEIGIQTLDKTVAKNISRPLNFKKIVENIAFLQKHTKAHLHLDLIVGLPGESLEQFGRNLDMLISLSDSEIQIGILKKLSGTRINRHDEEYKMVYSNIPPYDIISNNLLDIETINEMKRFARYWDLCYNSGNFTHTIKLIWGDKSVFESFREFSIWLYDYSGQSTVFYLDTLAEYIFTYLASIKKIESLEVANLIAQDIMKIEGRVLPKFLRNAGVYYITKKTLRQNASLKRQQKHI